MTDCVDWSQPDAMDVWLAQCAHERALTASTGKTAMQRAFEAIDAGARNTVDAMIAQRVRLYQRFPWRLETDFPKLGLPAMCGAQLVAFVQSMLASGRYPALRDQRNLRAAAIYGHRMRLEEAALSALNERNVA